MILRIAVQGPSEAILTFGLRQRGGGLRDERGVWVVNVSGAFLLVKVSRERDGGEQKRNAARQREPASGGAREQAKPSRAAHWSVLKHETPPSGGKPAG